MNVKQVLMAVVAEYLDLYCNNRKGMILCIAKRLNEIRRGDALPIEKNHFRVPYALRDEMKYQIHSMLDKGVILRASTWVAPVILVPKKSPYGTPRYRFCTGSRELNYCCYYSCVPHAGY